LCGGRLGAGLDVWRQPARRPPACGASSARWRRGAPACSGAGAPTFPTPAGSVEAAPPPCHDYPSRILLVANPSSAQTLHRPRTRLAWHVANTATALSLVGQHPERLVVVVDHPLLAGLEGIHVADLRQLLVRPVLLGAAKSDVIMMSFGGKGGTTVKKPREWANTGDARPIWFQVQAADGTVALCRCGRGRRQ
jgi:hypothetical protein